MRIPACQHRAQACAWNKHLLSNHRRQLQGWVAGTRLTHIDGNCPPEPDCMRALGSAGWPGTQERLDLLAHEMNPGRPGFSASRGIVLLSGIRTLCLTNRSPRVDKGRIFETRIIPVNLQVAYARTVPLPGLMHPTTQLSPWKPEERTLRNGDTQEETWRGVGHGVCLGQVGAVSLCCEAFPRKPVVRCFT